MIHFKKYFYLLILIIISACSSIPKNTQNSCAIFEERYLWYKHSKSAYEKWGVPIHIQLAFVKKESSFNWLAKPPRVKLFKIIPFKRPSSSFGYSQAVKGTWEQYKKETGNKLATRMRFKDSVDFIGWYVNKSSKILKISKKDAYRQYLAYYKGWGDYKNYKSDKKAVIYAKSVREFSKKYKKQLTLCKKNLDKNKYIIF
ncbi:MAG: lytic transglycosylase [Pelagibacteraceae bacterium]